MGMRCGRSIHLRIHRHLLAELHRQQHPRTLRQCRQFYAVYPLIWQTVSAKSPAALDAAVGAIAESDLEAALMANLQWARTAVRGTKVHP